METKHTPGPWHVEAPKPARFPTHRILTATDRYVAEVCIMAHNPAQADARLIAAAPETAAERDRLLAENKALREALERFANMDKVGMGNPRLDTIRHAFMVALPEYIGWCKQARAALSKARP